LVEFRSTCYCGSAIALTHSCLQFWGGMGFMNETPVSRAYRDSRLTSIGGGADEVMLTVLCKMMGTLPGMNQK
jgi:citronellyl-CoA dehydrogenase